MQRKISTADFGLGIGLLLAVTQGCSALSTTRTVGSLENQVPRRLPDEPAARTTPGTIGHASWYGPGFGGKKTASGEIFDDGKLTAAHKTLPLGSKARVTNLTNGRSVRVEINDRGPFIGNRIIDLSKAAAHALGMIDQGVVEVSIEPLMR